MFEFIFKKYKEQIRDLENRIDNMNYEWNKEKEIYTKKTKKRYYEQKVDFVIGGLDMTQYREIYRPMYGLSEEDAYIIAGMVKDKLLVQGIFSNISFHWNDKDEYYVIDVKTIPMKI